jgi:hypothetical protein
MTEQDDEPQSRATRRIELRGFSGSGKLSAGGQGHIELRGKDVVVSPEAIAGAAVVGEVTITAEGVVSAGGRRLTVPGAISAVVLADVIRHLLETAEDPSREAEVNIAVSLLIAVLLVVLGGAPRD